MGESTGCRRGRKLRSQHGTFESCTHAPSACVAQHVWSDSIMVNAVWGRVYIRYVKPEIAIAELLGNPANHAKPFQLDAVVHPQGHTHPGHVYGPISSAQWWARTLRAIRSGCPKCPQHASKGDNSCCKQRHALAIKLFIDATVADRSRGKHVYKPVLFTVDNLDQSTVNTVGTTQPQGRVGRAPGA
jgi:hypothetical protein